MLPDVATTNSVMFLETLNVDSEIDSPAVVSYKVPAELFRCTDSLLTLTLAMAVP